MTATSKPTSKPSTRKAVKAVRARSIEEGEVIEGYYLGYEQTATRHGVRNIHHVQLDGATNPDGSPVVEKLWGASDMNLMLAQVPLGNLVTIARVGKVPNTNRNAYEIEYDSARKGGTLIGRPGL